ncbi:MAG: hypothetical protein ACI94Y_001305 [Maribacter sp.]|jgi:hypothetical protein
MKNIFTSLFLCCVCTIMMAQDQGTSTLIIFAEDGLPFDLILNGVKQNENYETNIRIEGLTQPYYNAKILFKEKTLEPLLKKHLMVQDMDGKNAEATYIIKQDKKGRFKLKFYSAIPIETAPPAAENTTIVEFTNTPRPTTSISVTETTTTTISDNTRGSDSEDVDIDVSIGGMDVDMDIRIDMNDNGMGMGMDLDLDTEFDADYNSSSTVKTTTTTTTSTTIDNDTRMETMPIESKEPCSNYHMSSFEFKKALESISAKTFEDSKLTLAKQISNSNCITPLQVGKIMSVFDHENTRLEFATHAYKRVFDRSNYYKVNDSFEFESSIDDLNEALGL